MRWIIPLLLCAQVVSAQPLVNIETVTVGDPGNAADITGYGAVSNVFAIGKHEVTINQYTTFLNSVASVTSDSYIVNLWNVAMATNLNIAGISRSGSGTLADPYSYSVIGSGHRPITYVSWFDAARFANWMHNGATNGAGTETGAYTLSGATAGIITKNADATWWIPSENEWYKAAYYKGGGATAGYWTYPTQSDAAPGNTVGGMSNQANYHNGVYATTQSRLQSYEENYITDVGAFSNSASAYGTYDQAGNVWEWNDAVIGSSRGGWRGGSWDGPNGGNLLPSSYRNGLAPEAEYHATGLRVATVPEPSIPPVITLIGDNPQTVYRGTAFTDLGATVTDDFDATRTITGSGTVNTTTVGSYTLTYSAQDEVGNVATPVTRTVEVVLDPNGDEDNDGLNNTEEANLGTNPYLRDTDNDGVNDLREVGDATDPLDPASFDPLNLGLAAYYPFNGNANDESGNGLHRFGSLVFGANRFGVAQEAVKAASTSGDAVPPPNAPASRTVSFWLKIAAYSPVYFSWPDSPLVGNRGAVQFQGGLGNAGLGFSDNGYLWMDSGNGVAHFSAGLFQQWKQVIVVYEGSIRLARVYVDGHPVALAHWGMGPKEDIDLSNQTQLSMSAGDWSLDDLRVYNRALSATEVASLYVSEKYNGFALEGAATKSPFDPATAANWRAGGAEWSVVTQGPVSRTINSIEMTLGYISIFETNGTYAGWGSGWGIRDLNAVFPTSTNVTFSPNTLDDPNPYWYIPSGQIGAAGNKIMEASLYGESTGAYSGKTVQFAGKVTAFNLSTNIAGLPYVLKAFVKDFAPDFSSVVASEYTITGTGDFNVSLATINDPARHVRWGLQLKGPNIWPTDAAQLATAGSATIEAIPPVSSVTHDGVDSLQAQTTDGQSTYREYTVTGPAVVDFWWKVSSEELYDTFSWSVNGVNQQTISGEVDWTYRTLTLPEGTHTIRWTYTKDGSDAVGQDAGWLDDFAVYPASATLKVRDGSTALSGITTVDFSSADQGSAGLTKSLTFANEGYIPLEVQLSLPEGSAFTFEGGVTAYDVILGRGETLDVPITLSAAARGTKTAQLTIIAPDSTVIPPQIALLAEATLQVRDGATVLSGAATIDFGSADYGSAGATKSLTLVNLGYVPLDAELSLPQGSPFTFDGGVATRNVLLGRGEALNIPITLIPAVRGPKSAQLTIKAPGSSSTPPEVTLTGNVLGPVIGVATGGSPLASGQTIDLGLAPRTLQFTINNTGNVGNLEIAQIFATGNFQIAEQPQASIAPQSSTTFTVLALGGASGVQSGTVTITSNDTLSETFTINLSSKSLFSIGDGIAADSVATLGTGGALGWDFATTQLPSGQSGQALKTGTTPNNGGSVLEFTAQTAGVISWSWRVGSQENFDWLLCEVDGQEVAGISTKNGVWQTQVVQVPAGANVRWVYRKDASASAGEDAGYLADVEFRSFSVIESFSQWDGPHRLFDPQKLLPRSGMQAMFAWLGGFEPTVGPAASHYVPLIEGGRLRYRFPISKNSRGTQHVLFSRDMSAWTLRRVSQRILSEDASKVVVEVTAPTGEQGFFKTVGDADYSDIFANALESGTLFDNGRYRYYPSGDRGFYWRGDSGFFHGQYYNYFYWDGQGWGFVNYYGLVFYSKEDVLYPWQVQNWGPPLIPHQTPLAPILRPE